MFALLECYIMKLSIQWDKTVLMDVFKVGASSFRFSNKVLFPCLCDIN